jgi:hypothetical protein
VKVLQSDTPTFQSEVIGANPRVHGHRVNSACGLCQSRKPTQTRPEAVLGGARNARAYWLLGILRNRQA